MDALEKQLTHQYFLTDYSEGEERGRGETKHTLRVLSRDGSQQLKSSLFLTVRKVTPVCPSETHEE